MKCSVLRIMQQYFSEFPFEPHNYLLYCCNSCSMSPLAFRPHKSKTPSNIHHLIKVLSILGLRDNLLILHYIQANKQPHLVTADSLGCKHCARLDSKHGMGLDMRNCQCIFFDFLVEHVDLSLDINGFGQGSDDAAVMLDVVQV